MDLLMRLSFWIGGSNEIIHFKKFIYFSGCVYKYSYSMVLDVTLYIYICTRIYYAIKCVGVSVIIRNV